VFFWTTCYSTNDGPVFYGTGQRVDPFACHLSGEVRPKPLINPLYSHVGSDPALPLLCVIAKGNTQTSENLPTFLFSLLLGSGPRSNVQVLLLDTDYGSSSKLVYWMKYVNSFFSKRVIYISPISKHWQEANFPTLTNDLGYTLTQLVLNDLLGLNHLDFPTVPKHFRQNCEYVLVTNTNNVYHYDLYGVLFGEVQAGSKLIAFDYVTQRELPHPHINRTKNTQMITECELNKIDLGVGIAQIDLLKQISNHFVSLNETMTEKSFHSLGARYLLRLDKMTDQKQIVHQVLMIQGSSDG